MLVVTFKKVNPSIPVKRPEVPASRKRKKPGGGKYFIALRFFVPMHEENVTCNFFL